MALFDVKISMNVYRHEKTIILYFLDFKISVINKVYRATRKVYTHLARTCTFIVICFITYIYLFIYLFMSIEHKVSAVQTVWSREVTFF